MVIWSDHHHLGAFNSIQWAVGGEGLREEGAATRAGGYDGCADADEGLLIAGAVVVRCDVPL